MKAKGGLCLLLAVLLCLAGCSASVGSRGNAQTVPLDSIIEALRIGNAGVYQAAFPEDFVAAYQAQYPDFTVTLEGLLSSAAEKNKEDLGDTWSIHYELTASEKLSVDSLEQNYGYEGLDSFWYAFPVEHITDYRKISVTVYFEGSFHSFETKLTYRVLCLDGIWYLHPESFGSVLRSQKP